MKLIGTESGRVIQIVVPEEVRPTHGIDLPTIIQMIAKQYGFAKAPTNLEGFSAPGGLKFEHGRFSSPRFPTQIPIPELGVFNDGVIATCADTELADLMVEDFFGWMTGIGLLRPPVTYKHRQFVSNLIVQLDLVPPDKLSRMFRTTSRFDAALNEQYGWDCATSLHRLTFAADELSLSRHRSALFSIERRANIPYGQNSFWSTAPLPMAAHIRLLEGAEQDLISI